MKKISQTLLEFAAPLIDLVGPHPTVEARRSALQLAASVWNALVVDAWGHPNSDHETALRQALKTGLANVPGPEPIILADAIDLLVQRKRELFADDLRAIGDWELRVKADGEVTVYAQAHEAPTRQ
jgi:hypothetical protein